MEGHFAIFGGICSHGEVLGETPWPSVSGYARTLDGAYFRAGFMGKGGVQIPANPGKGGQKPKRGLHDPLRSWKLRHHRNSCHEAPRDRSWRGFSFSRCAMVEVIATDRKTGKTVHISMADSLQEAEAIISEEMRNPETRKYYVRLRTVRRWN